MQKRFAAIKERDAQMALVCGEAFQRLAAEFIPRIGAIKEEFALAVSDELGDLAACATNLGLAIELYLKALLTHLGLPVPQVHDLRDLYDATPQSVRALIEDVYDTKWPDQARQLRGRVSFTVARGPLEEPRWNDYKVSPTLPDLLARSRDIFQSWRYVFEFSQPEHSSYQFHQFEYGLLWCAAEAIRVEVTVRLSRMEESPPTDSLADES
jgi:hypothetical protein